MATREQHRQALVLVRWLTADTIVTPQQILRSLSTKRSVVKIRDEAAWLLWRAGGFSQDEVADCFDAYTARSAVSAATRRTNPVDKLATARRLIWSDAPCRS